MTVHKKGQGLFRRNVRGSGDKKKVAVPDEGGDRTSFRNPFKRFKREVPMLLKTRVA